MFFGNGRRPLLDFLRNLTPQILFLAFAFIAGSKLDLNKFDISIEGVKRTALYVIFLFIFFASLLANLTTFIEDSLTAYSKKDTQSTDVLDQKTGLSRFWALLAGAWKNQKSAVFWMFLVMLVAEGSILGVLYMGAQSAIVSPFFGK